MKNAHRLTEGAVLLAIYAVLLLITLYVPMLGLVSTWVLVLPFIYFSWKNDWNGIIVFFIASLAISLIVGSLMAIPATILFGSTGISLGYLTKKGKSRMTILLTTTLVFLVNVIAQYGAAVVFFEFNFIKEMTTMMNESFNRSFKMLEMLGGADNNIDILKEQIDLMMKMIQLLLPSMLVVGSFFIVFLLQLINFPILKRFGLDIPKWHAFRDVVLPKSILWYYLLTALLSIILKPEEGSFLNTALWNLSYILQILLVVQGLSFVYFVSHLKGWPKFIPILSTVFVFLVPVVLYIIRILGIIDLGFELRKRLVKK
ncbi:YybS family protein [Pseudoneobacillus sp. C159]